MKLTKKIPLNHGRVALVDDKNYVWLSRYTWRGVKGANTYYAIRTLLKGEDGYIDREHPVNVSMHRMIMNPSKGMQVDHINHNGWDNQENNLRNVTQRENLRNLGIEKTSKYSGVYWAEKEQKWMAYIYDGNKQKGLGVFKDEDDAHEAFLKADKILKSGDEKEIKRMMAPKKHSSKFKYVNWREDLQKWRSEVVVNGINYHVGIFDDDEEAYFSAIKKRQTIMDAIKNKDQNILEELSPKRGCSSKFKYVHWDKRLKKWAAQFTLNKKHYWVGNFDDEEKAHLEVEKKRQEVL